MRARIVFLFALLLAAQCTPKRREPAPTPSASATVSAAAVAPPTQAAPSGASVSIARFTKDTRLEQCADYAIAAPAGFDAGPEFVDGFAEAVIKDGGGSRIYKPCAEQFRTKPSLARCVYHLSIALKGDAGLDRGTIEIDADERYYDLDDLSRTDSRMKACLELKGDWTGLDKDSPEYFEAVRERGRRDVERSLKALGR